MKSEFWPALRATIVLTILTGIVYPLVTWLLAQTLFWPQANGSLIRKNGQVIGSSLLGQNFTAPGYFHPRPSANGYDAANSGGTNLGPTSDKLINGVTTGDAKDRFDGVKQLAAAVREENGLAPDAPVPVDAVTRSASGLDPDISVAYAELQIPRIAKQRHLSEAQVRTAMSAALSGRQFGVLGEPRVNVLGANLALDDVSPGTAGPVATPAPVASGAPDASASGAPAATPSNAPAAAAPH